MPVLCGDIGGTNARFALFQDGLYGEKHFEGECFECLEAVLEAYLSQAERPERACLAVAGPILGGSCTMPNLPWSFSEEGLSRQFGFPVRLVNDFYAAALGVSLLKETDRVLIRAGVPVMGAPVAVIGAGTGLGEASLIWVEGKAVVIPGEGGHTDLAPGNSQEAGFLQWLWKQGKSGCWEDALSGPGLVAIHRYLCESQGEESGGEALFAAEVAERDPEAMRIFWSLYGAEAGNMALRVLARGGVYLAGGIAAKNLDRLDREAFLRRFENKGALSRVLEAIPVYVVTEPSLGLLGAAAAMQPLE